MINKISAYAKEESYIQAKANEHSKYVFFLTNQVA